MLPFFQDTNKFWMFFQILRGTTKNIQQHQGNMCQSTATWFCAGHLMDIVLAIVQIAIYCKCNGYDGWYWNWSRCLNQDVVYIMYVIGIIKIVLHLLELLMHCMVKDKSRMVSQMDDQFNPKQFWIGAIFTTIHLILLVVSIVVILPNVHWVNNSNCCDGFPIALSVMLPFFWFFVILGRSAFCYRYKNSS